MTISLISKKQELTENLIKCYKEHLEQLNEMLAQSQKEDREMIDFVRAKKVRSAMEKKHSLMILRVRLQKIFCLK